MTRVNDTLAASGEKRWRVPDLNKSEGIHMALEIHSSYPERISGPGKRRVVAILTRDRWVQRGTLPLAVWVTAVISLAVDTRTCSTPPHPAG